MFTWGPSSGGGIACVVTDASYASTILLLRGQGTNGGTTITDSSPEVWVPDTVDGVITSTAQALPCFGDAALEFESGDNVRYSGLAALSGLGEAIGAGNNVWTLEAWVRQASSGVMGIMSYRPPAAIGWAFTTETFRVHIGGSWTDPLLSTTAPSAGVWSHRVVQRDGNDFSYGTDGVMVDTATNSGNVSFNVAEVRVGCSSTDDSEQPFSGHMYLRFTLGVARYGSTYTTPNNFADTA